MVGQIIDIKFVRYYDVTGGCRPFIKGKSNETKQTVKILKAWADKEKFWLSLGYGGCNFEDEGIILYNEGSSGNPGMIRVKLGNLPEAQLCNAYFTKDICFDLGTVLKQGETLKLIVDGYDGLPIEVKY